MSKLEPEIRLARQYGAIQALEKVLIEMTGAYDRRSQADMIYSYSDAMNDLKEVISEIRENIIRE